ncbi:MAG: hypothetical protein AB1465_07100 [Patescibacteria group bacterium]
MRLKFNLRYEQGRMAVSFLCVQCGKEHAISIFRLSVDEFGVDQECEFEICKDFIGANPVAEIVQQIREHKPEKEWQPLFDALADKIKQIKIILS